MLLGMERRGTGVLEDQEEYERKIKGQRKDRIREEGQREPAQQRPGISNRHG